MIINADCIEAMKELENGTLTINEYRQRKGRDPVEWGDTPTQTPDEQFGEEPENNNPVPNDQANPNDDKKKKPKTDKPEKSVYYKKAFEGYLNDRNQS